MTDDASDTANNPGLMLLQLSVCVALILAIGGLAYTANSGRPTDAVASTHADITGQLQVSYMLVTSKTASSESTSGSTISASRVQFFPGYVLVTTESDLTVLWAVDRLKKLEVARIESGTPRQDK